ncbi:hypothetical protein LTR64_004419 [Lithohypha guttulata]|uniref:uncharacterized protein n=1 Tax=Lithohypha guttulata TaxID=1690604 RepID=UPI002DDE7A07|nr:hypothetical protein LTR51_006285 [Lithohypha guttulata]
MASTGSKSVLILGGNGKTAKALTVLLARKQHKIYSVVRQESQASAISSLGAQPIIKDLEKATVEELSRIIDETKSEIIVWAAGAGYGDPSAPERVDHQAAVRTYDAAAQSGKGKRVIVISALDVRDRSKAVPDWYNDADKAGSERLWKVLDPYMHAKLEADKDLVTRNAERELKWTIGRLMRAGYILERL